jgi:membrane protein DedA with SNARE-associated domain
MLIAASAAVSQDIALLITLLGIGVVVNVLIVYIVGEVLAERRQNHERRERRG